MVRFCREGKWNVLFYSILFYSIWILIGVCYVRMCRPTRGDLAGTVGWATPRQETSWCPALSSFSTRRIAVSGLISFIIQCCGSGIFNELVPRIIKFSRPEESRCQVFVSFIIQCCGSGIFNELVPRIIKFLDQKNRGVRSLSLSLISVAVPECLSRILYLGVKTKFCN